MKYQTGQNFWDKGYLKHVGFSEARLSQWKFFCCIF